MRFHRNLTILCCAFATIHASRQVSSDQGENEPPVPIKNLIKEGTPGSPSWKRHYQAQVNLMHNALYECLIEMNESFRDPDLNPKTFTDKSVNSLLDGVIHFQMKLHQLDKQLVSSAGLPDEIKLDLQSFCARLKQPLEAPNGPLNYFTKKMGYVRTFQQVIDATPEICALENFPRIPQSLLNPYWCSLVRCLRELMTFQHNKETIAEAITRPEYKSSDIWRGPGFYTSLLNTCAKEGAVNFNNPCDKDNNLSQIPGAGAQSVITEITKINCPDTVLKYLSQKVCLTGDSTDEPIRYRSGGPDGR